MADERWSAMSDDERLTAFDIAFAMGFPTADALVASMTAEQWQNWIAHMRRQ